MICENLFFCWWKEQNCFQFGLLKNISPQNINSFLKWLDYDKRIFIHMKLLWICDRHTLCLFVLSGTLFWSKIMAWRKNNKERTREKFHKQKCQKELNGGMKITLLSATFKIHYIHLKRTMRLWTDSFSRLSFSFCLTLSHFRSPFLLHFILFIIFLFPFAIICSFHFVAFDRTSSKYSSRATILNADAIKMHWKRI